MSNEREGEGKEDELGAEPEFHADPEEMAEAGREVLAQGDAELQGDLRSLNLQLDDVDANYDAPQYRELQERRYSDPLSGARRADGADRVEKKRRAVEAILDKNSSGSEEQQKKKKDSNAKAYMAIFGLLIVAGAITGLVMTALNRKAHDQDDSDLPLPDDVKANIEALVNAWKSLPEDKFWGQMAKYADQYTVADLIYFMQYTMSLSPLTSPWLWNSSSDQDEYADKLISAYKDNGKAALFNLLPQLRYQRDGEPGPEPLPRYIAADLAQLALGEVTQN